jgi:cyclic pyranopterin monophosphate synthase
MPSAAKKLTHFDQAGRPQMVDVAGKLVSERTATATASVRFPPAIGKQLRDSGFIGKKGSLIDTAIIAGVMAAKRTHELIPFCHPVAIRRCDIRIEPMGDELRIEASVAVRDQTGVEMEALTAVTVAALTIYDMSKALSHNIVIGDIALQTKAGGKRDFKRGKNK